jgi:hypothetical protein
MLALLPKRDYALCAAFGAATQATGESGHRDAGISYQTLASIVGAPHPAIASASSTSIERIDPPFDRQVSSSVED